jgi:integrase
MQYVYPIKDRKTITAMRRYLAHDSKRNELLFLVGCNTAFRISDLLNLRFGDLYDSKGAPIKYLFDYIEKKTGKKKNLPIPKIMDQALREYIKDFPNWQPDDFLFPSRKGSGSIQRVQAHRIIANAAKACNVSEPIGTHSLRKSFAYHLYKETGNNIGLVQSILNHASAADTLRYIGIDREEMDAAYMSLNLG